MNYIMDFLVSLIAYLILPFIIFYKRENKFSKRIKTIILIFNSICISFLFIFLRMSMGYEKNVTSFMPAIFYFFVNSLIWMKKAKICEKTYCKIENDINNMNYEVLKVLKDISENVDETIVAANNITIYLAFFSYKHKSKKEQELIFDYIHDFIYFLETKKISKVEIEEIKNYILTNKTILENRIIDSNDVEGMIDFLVQKIINQCSDIIYSKYSSISVNLSSIISNYIYI